jgi:hypothetical protein
VRAGGVQFQRDAFFGGEIGQGLLFDFFGKGSRGKGSGLTKDVFLLAGTHSAEERWNGSDPGN